MTIAASPPASWAEGEATVSATESQRARRFVLFAGLFFLVGVLGIMGFSVAINCWGNFGPVGYLDVRSYNDRLVKVAHLDALPPDERPEFLVIGSSNVRAIRSADIEHLAGMRGFNFYFTSFTAEDAICLLTHCLEDLNYRPERLLVGLETWTFWPPDHQARIVPEYRRRLYNVPALYRHHPDGGWAEVVWSKITDCFSREQLQTSWRMWRDSHITRRAWGPLHQTPFLLMDGSFDPFSSNRRFLAGRMYPLDDAREFDITGALRETVRTDTTHKLRHRSFYDWQGLSPRRIELFEQFLALCQRERITTTLLINPIHPVMRDILHAHTPHRANMAELRSYVRQWKQRYEVIDLVFDASDLASFSGDPDTFSDGTHCGPKNSKRLWEQIVKAMPVP